MTKCPVCGYTDAPQNTHKSNAMNHYVNQKTGEEITMNSSEAEHTISGVVHKRKDLHSKGAVTDAPKQTLTEVKVKPEPVIVSTKVTPTIQTNTPPTVVAPQQVAVPPAKPGIVSPETVKPNTPQTTNAPK